jgi:hypothetical protein
MNYFLFEDDEARGPFTLDQLRSMRSSGAVCDGAYFCQEGDAAWQPITDLSLSHATELDPVQIPQSQPPLPQPPSIPVTLEKPESPLTQRDSKTTRQGRKPSTRQKKRPARVSPPEAKVRLRDLFRSMGMAIATDVVVGNIEETEEDWIASIVSTQESMADNYGSYLRGQDADILAIWPAQELVRYSPSFVYRDWKNRWTMAGGQLYEGRMVALKDSKVWQRLGDPNLFADALGNPFPPFAFNSGMGVLNIDREEALRLGVMTPATPDPKPVDQRD